MYIEQILLFGKKNKIKTITVNHFNEVSVRTPTCTSLSSSNRFVDFFCNITYHK